MSADSEEARHPIDLLADEYSARLRSGESPSIEEFVSRAPEHQAAIRSLFPTIAVMEQISLQEHLDRRSKRHPLASQDRLGDFRIVREIGRGGMGIVYEAEQRSLQRRVALKVLGTGIAESPHQLERFQREAEAVARLHHTNIVQVYGNGEEAGTHFFAMQFIDGVTLSDAIEFQRRQSPGEPIQEPRPASSTIEPTDATLITDLARNGEAASACAESEWTEQKPSDPPGTTMSSATRLKQVTDGLFSQINTLPFFRRVARLAAQVADALDYAHQHGVLHRDIKPSNVMLDRTGGVWIMDFGLVKIVESQDLTRTGEIVGTLRYMAPEQLNGQASSATDIYSLGLTLYELLTLKPAFEGDSSATLSQRLRGCEIPRPRSINPLIPRDLETILLKATARETSGRYPTAASLAEDLRRFCEDRPILARRSTLGERLWRWSRRNPALAIATSSAILLLGVVAAVATTGRLRVEAALRDAKSAQRQAEDNIDLAINAFGSILDNVTSRGLPRSLSLDVSESEAGLTQTPLSHADALLLDRLLEFYRDFARQSEGNSQRRMRIADAHHRAGTILVRLGRLKEAEQDFQNAIDLLANTPQSDPHYLSSVVESAAIYNEIGELRLRRGEFRQTSNAHLMARALLLEQSPSIQAEPAVRFELARSTDLLASIDVRSGSNEGPGKPPPRPNGKKPPRREGPGFHPEPPPDGRRPPDGPNDADVPLRLKNAEPAALKNNRGGGPLDGLSQTLLEACNEFRALSQEFPEKVEYQFHLAQCLRHRLVHAASGGNTRVARETFQEAVEILDRLAQNHPDEPRYLFELTDTLTQASRAQAETESRISLDRAVATAKELAGRFPSVSEYQLLLGTALARRAAAQANSGSIVEAEASLRQSIEILNGLALKFPDQGIIQIPLARTCQQLGDLLRTSTPEGTEAGDRLQASQHVLETAIQRFEEYLSATGKPGMFNAATKSHLYDSLAETLYRLQLPEQAEQARRKGAAAKRPGPPPR